MLERKSKDLHQILELASREQGMVSTKHCCSGECDTNSDRWPKSLKELNESGKKVFVRFPKPPKNTEKCKRWLDQENISREKHHYKHISVRFTGSEEKVPQPNFLRR